MVQQTTSINGVSIRLTDERWEHIIVGHSELTEMKHKVLEAVASPQRILFGNNGELLAVQEAELGKYLVVVYREDGKDGFIITAFFTRRFQSLNRRIQIWP